MNVGRKKYSCKYPGCINSYYVNCPEGFVNKHFYKFPKNLEYRGLWNKACGFNTSESYWVLCEDHFDAKHFVNEGKSRLNFNAVPFAKELDNVEVMPDESFENICSGMDTGHAQHLNEVEVISNVSDDYGQVQDANQNSININNFTFLNQEEPSSSRGILGTIHMSKKDLSPQKSLMYTVHRNVSSKLSKLRNVLMHEREQHKTLKKLFDNGNFHLIENNLNFVSKSFIESNLRNCNKKSHAYRYTDQDKVFALSLYKRSPRLYRYLQAYFILPSVRTLKTLLSNIPFNTGINASIMNTLKSKVSRLTVADKYCVLMFDEMSLSKGFHYNHYQQKLSGFIDLGSLGTRNEAAKHALVFMIRGIRKQWKQVVAYYFTGSSILTTDLKYLIKEIISELLGIGLNIVATVCDQGPTNRAAISQLCAEKHPRQSPYYFFINDKPIVTIFDVPHLLKNTRNALFNNHIQFEPNKVAKFVYIQQTFELDNKKLFRSLPKLNATCFNSTDSFAKMKVKIAANLLSHTMASAIETFSVLTNALPSEAIFTAEFVEKIDCLFDSLNGFSPKSSNKIFRCALSSESPHMEFWSKILDELRHWKILHIETGADRTNQFSFIHGWQITIRAIMYLWGYLKDINGFDYLSTKNLNQDPIENLFSCIRQHGGPNTNPTSHQFAALLKTVIVNKLTSPISDKGNCEDDLCAPLDDLMSLLKFREVENEPEDDVQQLEVPFEFKTDCLDNLPSEDTQALAYVAGYILKEIKIPDCQICHEYLYSPQLTQHHLFTSFKEIDENIRLKYASESVIQIVRDVHVNLYEFLESNAFKPNIEDSFKRSYNLPSNLNSCESHNCSELIINKCISFLMYKYVREKNRQQSNATTSGHQKKMRKFNAMA